MLAAGDELTIYLSEEDAKALQTVKKHVKAKRQFRIAYEDENILVCEKPFGLLTHGDHTEKKNHLANQVVDYLPGEAISGEMDAVTVPEGQLFVMGDNREYSEDSRSPRVGTIEQSTIVGKVIVRLYPFNSIKTFKGVDYES